MDHYLATVAVAPATVDAPMTVRADETTGPDRLRGRCLWTPRAEPAGGGVTLRMPQPGDDCLIAVDSDTDVTWVLAYWPAAYDA